MQEKFSEGMRDGQTGTVAVIRPGRGFDWSRIWEIWHFRELFLVWVWRDITVRYKQSVLGIAWALLQPVTTMVIFSIIFGKLAKLPSDGIPYPIFAYTAILPWQLFARALADGSLGLVNNRGIITKIYFPRILIPGAVILTAMVDFLIAFTVLLGMLAWYGIVPGLMVLTLPGFLLLGMGTALGVSLWFSVICVEFRDVKIVLPFITQAWMYLTPVVYPSSLIPEKWRILYGLNPMVSVVEGFRWALLERSNPPDYGMMAVSAGVVLLVLGSGLWFFGRFEKTAADVV